MNTVWLLSTVLLVVLFNFGTVSGVAHRILADKLPILPEFKTSKNGTIVKDRAGCETLCQNSRNYLLGSGAGGLRCLCSNETNPFDYGVIYFPGAIFKSEVKNVKGLDYFIYMGIDPVPSSRIRSRTKISLNTCALGCLNYPMGKCRAFLFDHDNMNCTFYSQPYDETNVIETPPSSRVLYFALLDPFMTEFSRQWGLLTPQNIYKVKNQSPSQITKKPYFWGDLVSCARKCYNVYDTDCDHIYFDIENGLCYNNSQPPDTGKKTFDARYIYFQQAKTDCPVAPSATYIESGTFRSPGFPVSYTTKPCSWKFLTPWGKALSVTLRTALPKRLYCWETVHVNNGGIGICGTGKMAVGQSSSGLNTVQLRASRSPSSGIAFIADYKPVWACQPGRQQLLLQGPGEIASNFFPNSFVPSVCSWKIVAESSDSVNITIQSLDFQSYVMLESATLTFSDADGTIISCNSTNICHGENYTFTSPVVIDFQSGVYYTNPAGFRLSYDFVPVYPQPDQVEDIYWTLNAKGQVEKADVSNLQSSRTVNLTYTITNKVRNYYYRRLVLTLGTISLGDNDKTNISNCIGGYLTVFDPIARMTYKFCNHLNQTTTITSISSYLTVNVVVPTQIYLSTSISNKRFQFSVTNSEDLRNVYVIIRRDRNFTSPYYPKNYPPKLSMYWHILKQQNKTAVLTIYNLKLGSYDVLTHHFCNNDRLSISSDDGKQTLDCTITQDKFPIRYINHAKTSLLQLMTGEYFQNSGFKANVKYYEPIGCNTTNDPITIKTIGPLISAQFDSNRTVPCQWIVDMDATIECVEGCDQVSFIEPLLTQPRFFNSKSTIAFQGTIISWTGTNSKRWFSALVSEYNPPTNPPTTAKLTTPRRVTSARPPTSRPTKKTTSPPRTTKSTTRSWTPKTSPITKKTTSRPPNTKAPRHSTTKKNTIFPGRRSTSIVIPVSTSISNEGGVMKPSKGSLSVGAIVGIVVGGLFFLIILLLVTLFALRRSGFEISNPFSKQSDDSTSPFANKGSTGTPYSQMQDGKANKSTVHKNPCFELDNPTYQAPPVHVQLGGTEDMVEA